ncbi:MAG: YdgA family protein [Pseudomonas sp.]
MTTAGKAAIALGIIAAAGVAGAWYTGSQVEQVLEQNIDLANEQLQSQFPNTDLVLEMTTFERSLFSSQARYRLVLEAAEGDDAGLELFINDHIEHGPLPLSRLTSFKWLPVMAVSHAQLEQTDALADLFAASAGRPPVTMTSSVGYGNGIKGDLQIAPLNWQNEHITSRFSGLSAVYTTDTTGSELQFEGRVDSIELAGRANVSLVGMNFSLDRQRDASGLYLGSGRMELDQLAAVVDDKPPLILNGMLQSDNTRLDADGANVEITYRIGSVSYGTNKLGSMDMDWTFSRFDPQAMMVLAGIYNSAMLGSVNGDVEAVKGQVQAALEQILEGQPRVSLDNFSIKTANGESRFSLGVDLDRPMSLELPPAMLMPQLISNLEAKLVLSKPMLVDMARHKALFQPGADSAAVEREALMMAEMVGGMAEMMQLGQVEGDSILSQLNYAGGAVKLNGQSIELEELVGLLAGMQGLQ